MDDRRGHGRNAALVGVVFVAALILLVGLAVAIRGAGRARSTASTVPGASSGSGATSSAASGEATQLTTPGSGPSSVPGMSDGPSGPAPSAAPSGDPVLVGAGDIADCGLDAAENTAGLLDQIPGTVFTAGDNAYPDGTDGQYTQCYGPTWGRHKARTRPAAGNHDYQTKNAAGYRDYFGAAATNAGGGTWYSYELGEWHVVVLDSDCDEVDGCGAESAQGRWLASDLASSTAHCTLAIWHHPRFSSGTEHGDDLRSDPFWRQLYAAGADVVINGHDHDYERFAPQDPDGRGDRDRGLREFVVGTGGAALRGFNDPVANSELRVSITHGVLALTLHPRGYDWEWLPLDGLVSDKGSGPCH